MKQFDTFSFKQQTESQQSISSSRKSLIQDDVTHSKQDNNFCMHNNFTKDRTKNINTSININNTTPYSFNKSQSYGAKYRHEKIAECQVNTQSHSHFYNKHNFASNFQNKNNPNLASKAYQINPKVVNLDKQIQDNLKKRQQLQEKLSQIKKYKKQQQSEEAIKKYSNNQFKSQTHIQNQFIQRNIKKQIINKQTSMSNENDIFSLQKSLNILKGDDDNEIIKTGYKSFQQKNNKPNPNSNGLLDLNYFLQEQNEQKLRLNHNNKKQLANKSKKLKVQLAIQPSALKITQLINRVTFPETPKQNILKLYDQCRKMQTLHTSHSDIIYLMMVCLFHLKQFHEVRKYFKQVLMFKKFQDKAYWVAAQAEYEIDGYEPCIKLTDICMKKMPDKFLPRFIYLKAKSYNSLGNYSHSIVCYNQLIKLRPKIGQYFLQRSVLFSRLGYEKQSRQDLMMFGILKPNGKQYLKQQIMIQDNESKRKQMLKIYSKFIN